MSHDGLMVRRRVVIAVHPAPGADPGAARARLQQAATARGVVLSGISPDVLEPAILEHISPEIILVLPAGSTRENAEKLAELAFGPEGSYPGVEHVHVASVLVHDLRFTRGRGRSGSPGACHRRRKASSRMRSGTTAPSLDSGALTVSYTGPLLSDALVESVRNGMARGAGVEPGRRYAGSPLGHGRGSGHVPRTGAGARA